MSTVKSIRMNATDARSLLARVQAERPDAFATLTLGELETMRGELLDLSNKVHVSLSLFTKLTGIAPVTVGQLLRIVAKMKAQLPSTIAWENGAAGAFIIDRPLSL